MKNSVKFLYLLFLNIILLISPVAGSQTPLVFQSLQTPKGIKLLWIENKNDATSLIQLAFKKSGFLYDLHLNSAPYSNLMAYLLQIESNPNAQTPLSQLLVQQKVKLTLDPTNREYFVIHLKGSPQALQQVLVLLTHYFTQLPITATQFKTLHKAYTQKLKAAAKSFDNPEDKFLAQRSLTHLLEKSLFADPDLIKKIIKSSKQLNLRAIKSYLRDHFTRENLIVSVAGNMTLNQLISLVDTGLNKLPSHSRNSLPNLYPERYTAQPHQKYIFRTKNNPRTLICFGQTWNNPTLYANSLIESLLNYLIAIHPINKQAIHLFDPIHINGTLRGCFYANHHQAVPKLIQEIKEIFKALKQEGFTTAYLEQIKPGLSSQIAQYFEQAKQKAIKQSISDLSQLNKDPQWQVYYLLSQQPHHYRQYTYANIVKKTDLEALSLDDLNVILSASLDPNRLSWVEVGAVNHLKTI